MAPTRTKEVTKQLVRSWRPGLCCTGQSTSWNGFGWKRSPGPIPSRRQGCPPSSGCPHPAWPGAPPGMGFHSSVGNARASPPSEWKMTAWNLGWKSQACCVPTEWLQIQTQGSQHSDRDVIWHWLCVAVHGCFCSHLSHQTNFSTVFGLSGNSVEGMHLKKLIGILLKFSHLWTELWGNAEMLIWKKS